MVNSTPIVIRSLQGAFPQSFRDLTLVLSVISDYGVLVVSKNSKYENWAQVKADFHKNPKSIKIAGGKALAGLLTVEVDILSTGFGEVLEKHLRGEVRIIGVTSEKSIQGIPRFKSMGIDAFFANWRGFFAAPNLLDKKIQPMVNVIGKMYDTTE
jgi:putative tricarboxylic transport membrane protein